MEVSFSHWWNPFVVQVTLVGKLVSCQELSTQLKFGLDDGTGTVEVCYWIDTDEGDTVRPNSHAACQILCSVG